MKAQAAKKTKTAAQGERAPPAAALLMTPIPTSEVYLQRKACACGGSCPRCRASDPRASLLAPVSTTKSLAVGRADDPLEGEADRAADAVMAASTAPAIAHAPGFVQRSSTRIPALGNAAPASVHRTLAAPGRPLEASLQHDMEQRFDRDFSQVRVHTDVSAQQSARDIHAHAYTVGQDIVFDVGRYAPGTPQGRHLIAHELAHAVQQERNGALVQRWANCAEANLSGEDCPEREAGEARRARADMVFFSQLQDPESGRTGALIANFDINKATIKANLSKTIYWQQFLELMAKEGSFWRLLGFADCHEMAQGGPSLRKERADAVLHALPETLQKQIVASEAAPESDCVRPNVTGGDRTMNRSVALILEQSSVDFGAEEGEDVIVGKTPADHLRECQAGGRAKTFPFRTTRFGGAPIMAHREGDDIVVKLPMHVKWNDDFQRETDTLPSDTFLGGTRLNEMEIVRVRHYELPHWYSLNITGDASDDIKTDYCVPAEKLLDFASATNKAFWMNVAVTGVEALTVGTPVGKWVGAGVSKVTEPVVNVAKGAAQKTLLSTMLALPRVAPSAFGTRTTTAFIEERAVQQVTTRAIAPAVAAPVTEAVAPNIVSTAAPRVGTSALGDIAPNVAAGAATELGGGAAQKAFDPEIEAAFSPAGNFDEGLFETAQRLIRGNAGERLAADALAREGHTILYFKPSILGTNQGGIDIVTLRGGVVNFIDNKALTRSGNVASVSALTTNFSRNMADVVASFERHLLDPALSQAERDVFQEALDAIAAQRYVRVVTNANISRPGAVLSGVTDKLKNQGIGFIDVMPKP